MPFWKRKIFLFATLGFLLLVALAVVSFLFFQAKKDGKIPRKLTTQEKHWQRVFNAAFESVDCPKPRDPQSLPDGYYKGPMIDTHTHIESLPDGDPGYTDEFYSEDNMGIGRSISEWVCMMDVEGTDQSWAFFPVQERFMQEAVDFVEKTLSKYPSRFVPFIGAPGNDVKYPTVAAEELDKMLNVSPGLFKGYGEIGLYARGNQGPALPPDSQRLREIYPLIRENNLVVYFHLGEDHKESFEKALEENKDIAFIFHGDNLIECEKCPKNVDLIADILEKHPNAYYGVDQIYGNTWLLNPGEVSKEEFIAHFSDYDPLLDIDLVNWKGLIQKYPDQVLWGTDRGFRWSTDPDVALVLNDYTRAFIGKLDPAVQEKFAYKTAERLISGKTTQRSIGKGELPESTQHIQME